MSVLSPAAPVRSVLSNSEITISKTACGKRDLLVLLGFSVSAKERRDALKHYLSAGFRSKHACGFADVLSADISALVLAYE